ncbi:tRNA (adenosine(37)-N6)-dimethylallyltransferase MiaA [Deinococcus sp.]|uniref:tRNA (adenosine(37)-N6)-dimethylallyltransferase MiaA n=1 Tax=Deinococcus sp. TaxID=47478 RepID=UPI003CC6700E
MQVAQWGVALHPVPLLTAPTASGKTALSLELAELARARGQSVEIVSADAFLVYRGLDIGTAKPTPQERAAAPHHLIDVVGVEQSYDVARYVREAEAAIGEILERGHLPLVVGGTGFYLSALTSGLPLTPPSQPAARVHIEAELEGRGLDALLAEIERHSPTEAARMERNPRRVVRALEVFRQTGRWPGEFGRAAPVYTYRVVAFERPEAEQAAQIARRVAAMFAQGWADEAAWLASRVQPDADANANADSRPTVWQALGYVQALAVARSEMPQARARAEIEVLTRQYGRRQRTWIRRQLGATLLTPAPARAELLSLLERASG